MNILRDLNLKLLFLVVFFSFASCETEKAIEAIPIRPVAFQEVTFSGANNVRTFSEQHKRIKLST
ncbi:MAG: hypothetical protein JKZ00_00555 [Flavobacteriaceae bacterium]|nr:hypothetical protein [Flavobacteriaceae bacterium]